MPAYPKHTAATAHAAYHDYYSTNLSLTECAKKHLLSRMATWRIVNKKGTNNERWLRDTLPPSAWKGVVITLEKPEQQMTREEMIRAAGGP
jgi:hypothetical protein